MAASLVFSRAAENDIASIVRDSIASFGDAQTTTYMAAIEEALTMLAAHPDMGARFTHDRSRRTYRRYRCGSHIVYYRKREADIFIVRLLHERMLPEKHL